MFLHLKHFVSTVETLCFLGKNKVFQGLKQKTAFFFIKTRIWLPAKTIIAEKTMFSFWDMSSQGLREKKICRDEEKSVSLYSHYKKTGKGLADS